MSEWTIPSEPPWVVEINGVKFAVPELVVLLLKDVSEERDALEQQVERLRETNKGLFAIVQAYHPEYVDGCSCPQCGDMPVYADALLEGSE